jgi:hypothetical protein
MGVPGNASPLLLTSAAGAAAGYQISRSVRFNSSDSAYLSWTPASSASSSNKLTYSTWVKRANLSNAYQHFGLSAAVSGSSRDAIRFAGDSIQVYFNEAVSGNVATSAVFRDASAWYHIVVSIDTTKATAADRIIIYVNGVLQTVTGTQPSQNYNFTGFLVSGKEQNISRNPQPAYYADSYLADIHLIDGQALDPTSFGEYDTNGVWQPIDASGLTFGTNGFHLPFSNNSTAAALGTDTSSNGNTWTVNNISVTAGAGNDSLVDSPTNGTQTDTGAGGQVRGNYATWNPLRNDQNAVLTNGNLDLSTAGSVARYGTYTTIGVTSAKWYWEITAGALSTDGYNVGIASASKSATSALGSDTDSYIYLVAGTKRTNNVTLSYGASYTAGDVIGVALDLDAGTLTFYKNGVSQGTAYTSIPTNTWFPTVADDATGSTTGSSFIANFGQRPFAYTAPSGFKALCTTNLPEPVVAKPSTVMGIATYSGNNGLNTLTTGVDASTYGGLLWIKNRSSATVHNILDNLRGYTNLLEPPLTAAEYSGSVGLTETSTGYTLNTGSAQYNASGSTYVAWHWAGGTSTVTNTAGSITSQVRANVSAGFSIVAFTATTGTGSIGHGLGVPPSLIILKSRNNISDWVVYHASLGAGKYLNMNTTDAAFTNTSTWQNTTPTSTVFYSNGPFATGWTEVAYCFAPVDGYSSFGSYTGNGSADGPFVYTGFRPRWLMIKRTDTTSNWIIYDSERDLYNPEVSFLLPNSSNAESVSTGNPQDFLSNGVKFRNANADRNASGATYIYYAVAENPFQYARAR